MDNLIGLRISYEDMANPYKEGRVVRVEQPTTPSGIELPEIATIAWEELDGTTRIDKIAAASLRSLIRRGQLPNRFDGMGLKVVAHG